jgi:hypothetical protein
MPKKTFIYDESLQLLREPYYALTMPLTFSVLTGIGALLLVASLSIVWDAPEPWEIGFVAFSLTQFSFFGYASIRWLIAFRRLTSSIAPYTDVKSAPETTIFLKVSDSRSRRYPKLAAEDWQLERIAMLALQTKSISEAQHIGKGKTFSRREDYISLRDQMLGSGLLQWKSDDTTKGTIITEQGWEVFQGYANRAHETAPLLPNSGIPQK